MSLIGSVATGLGSVPTAAGAAGGGGGSGGVFEVESTDGTVTVTNGSGPVANLSVPGANLASEVLIALLNYGSGNPETPDGGLWIDAEDDTTFYVSGHTDNDHSRQHGEVTMYPVHTPLLGLRLVGWLEHYQFASTAGTVTMSLILAIRRLDGSIVDTLVHPVLGPTDDNLFFDVQTDVIVFPGEAVGLHADFTSNLAEGSTMRGSFRVIGIADNSTGPFVSPDLTLWLESISDGGFDIATDGDGFVTRWPNRSTYGAQLDAIHRPTELSSVSAILVPDVLNGHPAVHFRDFTGGVNPSSMKSDQDTSVILAPVSGTHPADMHSFSLMRVNTLVAFAGTASIVYRQISLGVGINSGVYEQVPCSLSTEAAWKSTAFALIPPNPQINVLGQLVLVEFIISGGVLSMLINGLNVPLASTDPSWTGGNFVGYTIGSGPDGGGPEDADRFAVMVYKSAIGLGEAARTRRYIAGRFGVVL